jgi:hypothetical protein
VEAREGMTRPSMRMIGHTTYLVFARKVEKLQEVLPAPISEEEEEDESSTKEASE